jgi:hypothetical protein
MLRLDPMLSELEAILKCKYLIQDGSYDVLVFNNGNTFTLQGDGGFQNESYSFV